jgi:hypothetical protein
VEQAPEGAAADDRFHRSPVAMLTSPSATERAPGSAGSRPWRTIESAHTG